MRNTNHSSEVILPVRSVALNRLVSGFLYAVALLGLTSSGYTQERGGSGDIDSARHQAAAMPAINDPSEVLPEGIAIRAPGLYPEDVEWDGERKRFLVSSVAHGSVSIVRDDGVLEPFIRGGDGIKSSIGMHIDRARNRLLVAAADFAAVEDPKVKGGAKLAIYNLTTGERERLVDLAALRPQGRHLANDVTVDPQGNAYVTDSLSPLIYRITPEGDASVFMEEPNLDGEGVNLNGIAYHPDGYLLVVVGSRKALYRMPVDGSGKLTQVRISEPVSLDSLTFRSNGNLVAATPFVPGVIELASEDGWQSARVVGRAFTFEKATTTSATLRGDVIYALNSHFDEMGKTQPVPTFEIWRAKLR